MVKRHGNEVLIKPSKVPITGYDISAKAGSSRNVYRKDALRGEGNEWAIVSLITEVDEFVKKLFGRVYPMSSRTAACKACARLDTGIWYRLLAMAGSSDLLNVKVLGLAAQRQS